MTTETKAVEKREAVAYTVLEKSLVGNKIYEEGETAMYDGLPAENLAPQCDIGKARFQEYLETNKARVKEMLEKHSDNALGDAATFGKIFLEALAKSNAEHAAQMAAMQQAQSDAMEVLQAGQAQLIAKIVASAMATAFPDGTANAAAKAWTPKEPAAAKATKVTKAAAAEETDPVA